MIITRPPRPPLLPFVSIIWTSDECVASPAAQETREHVLPTGHMHLVFRLSDAPLRVFDGAEDLEGCTYGSAVVGGARSTFYARDISKPSASVGAMLRPGAALALFGVSAAELAERHTRLDELWRNSEGARARLLAARSPTERLATFESLLAARLPSVRGLHPAIAFALARFGARDNVLSIVAQTGYSHRHFIGLFREAVGLAPKTFARLQRFQHALRSASNPDASWASLALDAGYSDQAHFSRDFLELTGMTPSAYRRIRPARSNHVAAPSSARR